MGIGGGRGAKRRRAGGFGDRLGTYISSETLAPWIEPVRGYVLEMGSHWMRVEKTGANAVTIRQKDQESSAYKKDFTLDAALAYILDKYSPGGKVYKND